MPAPPGWKIKRELTRLGVQARAIPQLLFEPFIQRRYDRDRAQAISVEPGAVPTGRRAAIVLIYQPRGIPASLLHTLDHLVRKDFSPIAISNAPLATEDRAPLLERSSHLAQRPNFGYDFGGYRDGIWLLERLGLSPETLLILNDSVFFPIGPDSDLLDRMQAADADYVGTQVFVRPDAETDRPPEKRGFYGSYCFLLKEPLLGSDGFQRFWNDYRLSSNKEVVLRRGERAFSRAMFALTDRHAGLYSRARFDAMVDDLPAAALREALGDLVCLTPEHQAARQAALAGDGQGEGWCAEARALIKSAAETKNYIGSSPVLSVNALGFPMVKKNNEMLYRRARQVLLRAHDEGRLAPLAPVVADELRALVARDGG